MTELKVFPPTRTDTYDRCQLLDHLENRDRWVPRQATKKLVGGLAGRAFALGVSIIHTGGDPKDAGVQAATSFEADMVHYATHGVSFEGSIPEIVEASGIMVSLPKYAAANPFRDWKVQDVERQLPEHGRCIIDLGGLDADDLLAVADVKYKQNLDARYERSTIDEYMTSWQFLHYPWAYGEYKGTPCYRMYLCLVVNKPKFSVRLIPNEVHPETQAIWLASARAKWARMAQDGLPEMASRHKDMFGLCSFYNACFKYHLDEGLMAQEYVKVPDRRKVAGEPAKPEAAT
jgi:hypothetical protein